MSIDPGEVTARLFDIRGRRAVVTGAASGLGLAIARCSPTAAHGSRSPTSTPSSSTRSPDALTARGCDVRTAVVDVTDDASVRAAFDGAVEAHGGVDIVFANAGIAAVPGYANPGGQELHAVEDDVWRRVTGVNLDGVLHTHARRRGA